MHRLLQDVHGVVRRWWDPGQRLLAHPGGLLGDRRVARADAVGLPAPTSWWAHGLLARGGPGDRELAEVAVEGVLACEVDTPTAVGLALLVRDHRLPATLAAAVRASVERHVRADHDEVIDVTRTSAVVQRAWLELEVGTWTSDEGLLAHGAELARAIAADAGVRGHVAEHNSPTATGMTLLGLSLWAERPPVGDLAPLGRALRDEVWHDVLAVWHPGLRTLTPPFTRATGMDLRTHVTATGLWLSWLVDGADPLPQLGDGDLDDAQDLPLVFLVDAVAGASPDVRELAPLVRAQPARQGEWFDRVGERVWTGWTGGDLAVGAAWSPADPAGRWQVVTAAAIWRSEDGGNAWLRLHQRSGPVHARVEHVDATVRLVHGTTAGPVELWTGGHGDVAWDADRMRVGGRTWTLDGVATVVPVERDVRDVALAWELGSSGDGIVLTTEVG